MTRRTGPNGQCRACQHVERARIELLLASGASIRSVAKKFDVEYFCLRRHWQKHVSDERKGRLVLGPVQREALAARVSEESESVLDHFKAVRAGLYQLYQGALEAGDRNGGALLAGRLHENLNSLARLTGELAQSPLVIQQTTNILISREVVFLQAAILRALVQYPEARIAVIREFREFESRTPPPVIEHDSPQAA